TAGTVQQYMLGFVIATGAIIYTSISKYRMIPTHVLINKKGIRFSWRHRFAKERESKIIQWKDLNHISLLRPPGKTSTLHDALVFESVDGTKTKIKLDSFDSFEDKEWILKAIKNWAPNVSRDAEVLQALQAPADYSYTELWLQALSAPPKRERLKPLLPGVTLKNGKYEVVKSIGVGGQGQAYLATDAISMQRLVLKEFILPVFVDMSVRKGALEQFENEARILRQLDHSQVVKLLDYFVEDHRAYLVLEHIDGASLRQLVERQGPLPEAKVRALASQMCKILSYLHGLKPPVVHRDFTPDNLILNNDGTLKLIDFNVAQQQESTTSGTVVGKHAYLPPEQFRGMPGTQSDIYAMGATLFYLLTGKDPEPISRSHPGKEMVGLSASIDELVAKATTINLKDRYACVEDLDKDLHSAT
ncbi:MAG: serine/threonine protein kinase, partial [Candidatus Obscuribacterales bacterium]|nr:serine/threonine protein kinase [Candidatus Obscuribacterales bacterium]